MDLTPVFEARAGIEMLVPEGAVSFEKYEYPFVHFRTDGVNQARLLMISQPGTQATLYGLYDILQTLEIVPLDGPRSRKKSSFVLEGSNSRIVSYTEARLERGEIKGFTLIWPAGDEERRRRILNEVKASFRALPGSLQPDASEETQAIDLISGLKIRTPRLSRSGFFTDGSGTVLTTAQVVRSCTRITLGEDVQAEVAGVDRDLGIAVLRPAQSLAPVSTAQFLEGTPRLKSDVAVSGYSYEGLLSAPTLTFGTVADVTGLRGERNVRRLALTPLPGDAGGPVLDEAGAVVGMLLPRNDASGRSLPADVSFVAAAGPLADILVQVGAPAEVARDRAPVAPEDLTQLASNMTVLVSCWD